MKSKKFQKFLPAFLALGMLIGYLPTTASAQAAVAEDEIVLESDSQAGKGEYLNLGETLAIDYQPATDDFEFKLDDGSGENSLGTKDGLVSIIALNRFSPGNRFPFLLTEISFLSHRADGSVLDPGQSIRLVVFQNTKPGVTDPSDGAELMLDKNEIVKVARGWNIYHLDKPVLLEGPGDVLIGILFEHRPGSGYYPAVVDENTITTCSWVGVWATTAPSPITIPSPELWGEIGTIGFPGTFTIRGKGISAGDGETLPDTRAFLPNPDGYSYSNSAIANFPPMLTVKDMQVMCGDASVCVSNDNGICIPKATVTEFVKSTNRGFEGGVSGGIAISSMRYHTNKDSHSGYSDTFDLGMTSPAQVSWNNQMIESIVHRNIAFFQAIQLFGTINPKFKEGMQRSPSETLFAIKTALDRSPESIYMLYFFSIDEKNGHAFVPYGVEFKGDGIYWIRVYDSNYPDNLNRHITIDYYKDTWTYNQPFYWGDNTTKNLGIMPISLFDEKPNCSHFDDIKGGVSAQQSVTSNGIGEVLIVDSQNRMLGFKYDEYFDEIPGAYSLPNLGGLDLDDQPNYYLPTGETYTITLSSLQSKGVSEGTLSTFGPGYGITIYDINLTASSSDTLIIANDGSSVTYNASTNQQPSIGMALDGENGSWLLEIQNLGMAAGEASSISTDMATNSLEIESSEIHDSQYDLFIMGSGTDSMLMFYNKAISKLNGETHTIRFDQDGKDVTAILEIDKDGDGIADEVIILENMINKIYLPMIFK